MARLLHLSVFEDNNGALALATTPKINPRTKHIAVKYFHFRSHVGPDKGVHLVKVDTSAQLGDQFTKGLGDIQFKKLRKLLMGW